MPDLNPMPDAIWPGQGRVRFLHGGDVAGDIIRKAGNARPGHVDMQPQSLARGGEPAVKVPYFLIEMKTFVIMINKLRADLYLVIQMQFAHITKVKFGGIGRVVAGFGVFGAKAKRGIGLIHAGIKQHVVVGHVEMAVIIDPFGFDAHCTGHVGGGDGLAGWHAGYL